MFEYCVPCGQTIYGKTPRQKKQEEYFAFIDETYGEEQEIVYDRIIGDQTCSKKRPDVHFSLPFRNLFVEIDENQHKFGSYNPECEIARMNEIFNAAGTIETVFIRFNPDGWKDEDGVTRKISKEDRKKLLKKEIDRWLDYETEMDYPCQAVYLYYDGEIRRTDEIPV
jgi:hypothetical protein